MQYYRLITPYTYHCIYHITCNSLQPWPQTVSVSTPPSGRVARGSPRTIGQTGTEDGWKVRFYGIFITFFPFSSLLSLFYRLFHFLFVIFSILFFYHLQRIFSLQFQFIPYNFALIVLPRHSPSQRIPTDNIWRPKASRRKARKTNPNRLHHH